LPRHGRVGLRVDADRRAAEAEADVTGAADSRCFVENARCARSGLDVQSQHAPREEDFRRYRGGVERRKHLRSPRGALRPLFMNSADVATVAISVRLLPQPGKRATRRGFNTRR
jgi:hypothetical protein